VLVIDPGAFKRASDFAAPLRRVPRQDGTGGKVRPGPISKYGNGYLRWLLVKRRDSADQMSACQARSLGCQAARRLAAQAGGRRSGQQAGAHRLGVDGAPGGLPRSAGGGLSGCRRKAWKTCEGEDA
jgi:transposase